MRRVRHLVNVDYVIPIRQKVGSVSMLSCRTLFLERTWHDRSRKELKAFASAKFDASNMNGVQLSAYLGQDNRILNSVVESANLYRVSEANWTNTLVSAVSFSSSGAGFHSAYLNQTSLGLNELSGRETYMLDIRLARVRRKYGVKVYFNHLGCFDSLNLLRQRVEELDVIKADD